MNWKSFFGGIIVGIFGYKFVYPNSKTQSTTLPTSLSKFSGERVIDNTTPREGKGRFRVYVQRHESGGKDYYFPTAKQRDIFFKKMNKEYKSDDPSPDYIEKVR